MFKHGIRLMQLFIGCVLAFSLVDEAMSDRPAIAAELDNSERPPRDWKGAVFVPNFAFPLGKRRQSSRPWEEFDFRKNPREYLFELLEYVMEGQNHSTWRVGDNTRRLWYHAPWMGPGPYGRDFISGLTRGRNSLAGELGQKHRGCRQNWALVIFDGTAARTLARIWAPVRQESGPPDLGRLPFGDGSVIAKFQFTEATVNEVPELRDSPTILANIHVRTDVDPNQCPGSGAREPATLRLLQVDIAVRDNRANSHTGWVFGSFAYDGLTSPSANVLSKLRPIGLMWGNDPLLSDEQANKGLRPQESRILEQTRFRSTLGRGGRMNGPIDDPQSSCVSCHSTAQWPNAAPLLPPKGAQWSEASCWFRNLPIGVPFGSPPSVSTRCGQRSTGSALVAADYNFQVAIGVRNWFAASNRSRRKRGGPGLDRIIVNGIVSKPMHRSGR